MTDTEMLRVLFGAEIALTRDQIGYLLAQAEATKRVQETLLQWDECLDACKDAFARESMYGAGVRSLASAAQDLRTALDGTKDAE